MSKPLQDQYDAIVIGGGFYGCSLALALKSRLPEILLLEREPELLTRASYANQARVHNGYHYPRSLPTAMRSAANYPTFTREFQDCVDGSFTHIYAVARGTSKVSAYQFRKFCQQVEIPLRAVPASLSRLFNPALIEETFVVEERAFDAAKLREQIAGRLHSESIEVCCGQEADRITAVPGDDLRVRLADGREVTAPYVFNCGYSQINRLLDRSALAKLPLKHELAELALIETPPVLSNVGITVMDGPYFSTIPFPSLGYHTLSHVTYTPHEAWSDTHESVARSFAAPVSKSPFMLRDAQRYVPMLREARYVKSLFETKTVLPRNEIDDGRPILCCRHPGANGLFVVLGAKIDNIYDIIQALESDNFTARSTHASYC